MLLGALSVMTVFFRSTLTISVAGGSLYNAALFYGLFSTPMMCTVQLLLLLGCYPVFHKQREALLYPAWAWFVPMLLMSLPISLFSSVMWTAVTYYTVGFAPELTR